jgi:hypothetical protein
MRHPSTRGERRYARELARNRRRTHIFIHRWPNDDPARTGAGTRAASNPSPTATAASTSEPAPGLLGVGSLVKGPASRSDVLPVQRDLDLFSCATLFHRLYCCSDSALQGSTGSAI